MVLVNAVSIWFRFRRRAQGPRFKSRHRYAAAGFVLPAMTLLLLLAVLCLGAITLRSYDHLAQAGRDRQQQAVVNAASPAVDRAQAKLSHLLDRRYDSRRPAGIDAQNQLHEMLRNQKEPVLALADGTSDPYTFPDETRLDISGDGQLDNAWRYRARLGFSEGGSEALSDTAAANAANATVVYGIWLQPDSPTAGTARQRALQGIVRHAPLSNALEPEPQCQQRYSDSASYKALGWTADPGHPSLHRKNIQVDVVVLPDRPGHPVATLELQQDLQVHQGFPWGVWFQDDLEIASARPLSWSGALHTEGSLVVDSDKTVALFPVSAAASCLSRLATPITVGQAPQPSASSRNGFQGHVLAASLNGDRFGGSATLYGDSLSGDSFATGGDPVILSRDSDSWIDGPQRPSDLLLDPLLQLTEARQAHRNFSGTSTRDGPPHDRFHPQAEDLPDRRDRYRADNRYGPTVDVSTAVIPGQIGEPITGEQLRESPAFLGDQQLIRNAIDPDAPPVSQDYGLDGYWERRARAEGLRIVVGQRLVLGDALPPWPGCAAGADCYQRRQQRLLQDAAAAVQSTVIYPANAPDLDHPSACLISTVHPGTAATLTASSTFTDRVALLQDALPAFYHGQPLVSDVLTGQGTNGWEYAPLPAAIATESAFARAIAPTRPLGQLLRNWAHFAGDPQGGSPSFTPASDTQVHPYPGLAAWGDASWLRRALLLLETTPYAQLSPADKTTLHSATCTLGMLAYNLGYLVQLTYPDGAAPSTRSKFAETWQALDQALREIDATRLDSPQAVLAALQQQGADSEVVALARTVALKEQVQRDRQYGFAAGAGASALVGRGAFEALIPDTPAFPALHYLVPRASFTETRIAPWRDDAIVALNRGWRYQPIPLADENTLRQIAVAPRPLADWWLPHQSAPPGPVLSDRALYLSCSGAACSGELGRVQLAIKDAALFDGREGQLVRTLDLDLDQLRQSQVLGDSWLPSRGLVYGFREDAVREDGISRPPRAPWAACSTYPALIESACQTRAAASAFTTQDPPRSDRAISPKPVDDYPDPDRRPFGFRLRHGDRLDRGDHGQGLSFITDNPVYIMGPFNRHQVRACPRDCPLEEFRSRLPDRRPYQDRHFFRRHRLDPRFADPQRDSWRASAIWADSITVLSEQFCDGSIEDGWVTAGSSQPRLAAQTMARYGCHNRDRRTSFLNQNRPRQTIAAWQRVVAADPTSAIAISPDGAPILANGQAYAGGYFPPTKGRPLIEAQPLQVNGIFLSGRLPAAGQSAGGLTGHLRLLERWDRLSISGALVQVGASYYAAASGGEGGCDRKRPSPHYSLGQWLGGYDVALQYGPAPLPVRQFVTLAASPRHEAYHSPALTDPYLQMLCQGAGQACP